MIALQNILVPYRFDDSSERALHVARMLADACGASLHLVHVIPPAAAHDVPSRNAAACRRLDAVATRADREARHLTIACRVGTPAAEIVRYAADNAIDLIVMITHPHGPAFQMATGSIADSVLGCAPCAVLALKGPSTRPYDVDDRTAAEVAAV